MKWQPIETAPKDGTRFLAYDPYFTYLQIAWWGEDYNMKVTHWLAGEGDDYSTGYYFCPVEPTHWMPLPKPPKETQ